MQLKIYGRQGEKKLVERKGKDESCHTIIITTTMVTITTIKVTIGTAITTIITRNTKEIVENSVAVRIATTNNPTQIPFELIVVLQPDGAGISFLHTRRKWRSKDISTV